MKVAKTQLTDWHTARLLNRYNEYVDDHKKLVKANMISREDNEYTRSAQNFIDYLIYEPGSRQVDLSELSQDGYDAEGISFFNKIQIPLKK